jgi:hypothetical protein
VFCFVFIVYILHRHYIEHAISTYNDKVAHGEGLAVVSLQYYPLLYEWKPEIRDQFEEWASFIHIFFFANHCFFNRWFVWG